MALPRIVRLLAGSCRIERTVPRHTGGLRSRPGDERGIGRCARALLIAAFLGAPALLAAQSPCSGVTPATASEGITSGNYMVHSSLELGYRATDITGTSDMYNTLVNLRTGPRFLDETVSMQSLDHQGLLFDNFYLTSCGWGGDPNNALRLRTDKDKWYDLQASFRRDENFFDYDLLANPLNPSTSTPVNQIQNSPNQFDTTRRMSDVDLTLLPQSMVSVRLGFSHNNMTGPVYSSIHEGTEALLLQPWNTTMNTYRVGVDFKILPRTVLFYDEVLDYYKGDTDTQLAPYGSALLPGGGAVQLGLSWDTLNKEPCGLAAGTTTLISAGTLTNTTCSGYFGYSRDQRIRTSNPTERAGFRSNFFPRIDLVGSFSYSDAEMSTPLDESFSGLITRTSTLAFLGTGTASASRISDVGDFGATVHLTRHLRFIEKFYFWAYRIPQNGNFTEVDSDCTNPKACNLLTPLTATATANVPTLTDSSFNQTLKRNQDDLAWDISKQFGARIGYRYSDRVFTDFATFAAGGETIATVHEQTALAGIWARPTRTLRLNLDVEHSNFDNVIVPIAPRKESRYRFQTTYNPRPWALAGGSINILDDANAYSPTDYVGHNRNYGLFTSLNPRAKFGLDLAYNYNDVVQNAFVCFADTPPTNVTLPFVTGAAVCPGPITPPATTAPDPLLNYSEYTNHTQFGMATVRFRFDKRTTVFAGGSVTNVDGDVPQFNVLQPLGSLQYRYYQPVASLSVDLGHKLAWNTGWNYYQYNEGSFVGPTAPRYFHANNVMESLRYAF